MVNNTDDAIIKAKRCIQDIYQHGVILEKESDNLKDEYEIMVSTTCVQHKDDFLSFNINEDRLDLFLAKYLAGAKEYSNLWKVVKILLIISHGQSVLERGFSINKEISVQNMQKPSLIFQRIIYDYMHTENVKLTDVVIDKGLLVCCRGASSKYKQSLEEKKKEMVDTEVSRKRKMKQEEILETKKRKEDLQNTVKFLEADIGKYSLEVETKRDLMLLVKANSFRTTKEDKLRQIEDTL